ARGGSAGALRRVGPLRGALVAAALPLRRMAHRGRRLPFHHALSLRSRLLPALQVQRPPDRRLPGALRLPARRLPDAGRGRVLQPRSRQAALLPQPPLLEPAGHRSPRPRARPRVAPRPRALRRRPRADLSQSPPGSALRIARRRRRKKVGFCASSASVSVSSNSGSSVVPVTRILTGMGSSGSTSPPLIVERN